MDRCSCWVVLTGGVWRIQKPLKSPFFRPPAPCFLLEERLVLCFPLCTDRSLRVRAASQETVCARRSAGNAVLGKNHAAGVLLVIRWRWKTSEFCVRAASLRVVLYHAFFLGVTIRPFCILNGKIIRCLISRYGIDLGDSVSFRLCSDLFTVKSDFQTNIRSYIYLYDNFWTCILRT